MDTIFLNGKWVPRKRAVVSVFDRGFMFGDSVYEVLAVTNGKICALRAHVSRLKASLDAVGINLKESIDDNTGEEKKEIINTADSETRLFGGNGILDSMDAVILLADLEEKLDEHYDITISLASESMMSKARSPFRSIKSLSNYIVDAVNL